MYISFFLNDTAPTEIYTLSLHDALPIWWRSLARQCGRRRERRVLRRRAGSRGVSCCSDRQSDQTPCADRKSTRLNSSHSSISYAVFCLKKKKKTEDPHNRNHKYKPADES